MLSKTGSDVNKGGKVSLESALIKTHFAIDFKSQKSLNAIDSGKRGFSYKSDGFSCKNNL